MKHRIAVGTIVLCLVTALLALPVLASDAQMYFASDKNGQNRVTNIQEGDEIFIVVIDNDENIDCDVRDKIWTDVKIMDPKTGAYIVWRSYSDKTGNPAGQPYDDEDYVPYKGHYPGTPGWTGADYLEETGADTGVFVSKRAFQVGTRENYDDPFRNTHVVDDSVNEDGYPLDFQWGGYLYADGDGLNGERDNIAADDRCYMKPDLDEYEFMDDMSGALLKPGDSPSFSSDIDEEVWDGNGADYLIGRFENMDTLVGMYQDQNDDTDVAVAMMKIIDTEATISWDQEIYKDANSAATITVVDPDENLNCNEVEYVPVFIIVNPGSWNPDNREDNSGRASFAPTTFCSLLHTGGVAPVNYEAMRIGDPLTRAASGFAIRWYNIYSNDMEWTDPTADDDNRDPVVDIVDGVYYIEYAEIGDNDDVFGDVPLEQFDTVDQYGICRVSFFAQETGVNTGVFQLNLNSILVDLGFNSLRVRDVLVAYYLDPNDFDDFKLAAAYIEERQHSVTSFTDENRTEKDLYWLGRDPIYVQVIDANANVDPCCPEQVVVHICDPHGEDDSEYWILDETSSNSPVFFSYAGMQLRAAWDALGVGIADLDGGFQIQWDNWKFEAFNEDDVMARYNDVYYETDEDGLAGLGDVQAIGENADTPFPPEINRIRVANDVSFDLMSIADTQVYDGTTVNMYFLDRQGNRVAGYVNSDCVFIEVIDPDQDEDQYRRERVSAFWSLHNDYDSGTFDAGGNAPFGPMDRTDNHEECGFDDDDEHEINALLGDTNIFTEPGRTNRAFANVYVLNPRNGYWAPLDVLETGIATGDFVSVTCIDLVDVYECVPSLGVLPGDTLVAFYQDPSNHSDNAMISIKVGIGGAGTPPSQQSTTMFVDAAGNEVADYTDADLIYVKVIDPSHTGAETLENAVEIDGQAFSVVRLEGAPNDTFITAGLDLGAAAGDTITATYEDPTDPTDTSSDTITIVASVLAVDEFYAAPNPFDDEAAFGYTGSGIASVMSVAVYDLTGTMVWSDEQTNVSEIVWNGTNDAGVALANGAYLYTITATDGTNTFHGKGLVFVNR